MKEEKQNTANEYPGRWLHDAQRSPVGLGWEYARRGWGRDRCPLKGAKERFEFSAGYDQFICSDPEVNKAMLTRGVSMESPTIRVEQS